MESSDPTPSHSDGAPRSSPPQCSSSRIETGQRLVDRMPINPRTLAFISTQERFEVPLRPELWSAFAAGTVPASDLQQRTNPPACQHGNVTGRGRTNSVRRRGNSSNDPSGVAGGSHVRKRRRTTTRSSGRMDCPPDQSTRLTDYYPAQGEREVPTRPNRQRPQMTHVQPELPQIHIPRLTDLLSLSTEGVHSTVFFILHVTLSTILNLKDHSSHGSSLQMLSQFLHPCKNAIFWLSRNKVNVIVNCQLSYLLACYCLCGSS